MNIRARATELGMERHPDAPPRHHEVFADAVTYAVTALSGQSLPTMRKHEAVRLLHRAGIPGAFSFYEAVLLCEQVCYGPLTLDIARMLQSEHCFHEVLGEITEALRLLDQGK